MGLRRQHLEELADMIDRILVDTGHNQVNIVGHSKGGLDARTYIATGTGTDKVANLIMIGTPNAGTSAAIWDFTGCFPAGINELLPGSPGTTAKDHPEIPIIIQSQATGYPIYHVRLSFHGY